MNPGNDKLVLTELDHIPDGLLESAGANPLLAAILIGVILGPLLERYFLLALKKSDGDVMVLFSSTLGNVLWVALAASLMSCLVGIMPLR